MAEATLATTSQVQKWKKEYFLEYVRLSGYKPYMTNSDMNKGGIILTKFEELQDAGKIINVPFIGRLKSSTGVTGSGVMDGAEESLTNFNCAINIDWRRNAVRVPKSQQFMTEMNLINAARDALLVWEMEKIRDDITDAFGAPVVGTTGVYTDSLKMSASSAAQRNTWAANNSDRMLFGNLKSNFAPTYSTALLTVGVAAGKATIASASLCKRIAKLSDPHIRPFRTAVGREYYVAFHGSRSFRDIKADALITNANLYGRPREDDGYKDNPLFQDGDIVYDGVIHHEVPEIDAWASATGVYDGQGLSGADVRPVFVCGGGCVGIAWGQEPTPRSDYLKDYGFRPGVAIEELVGIKKIAYNGVQNGMVTWHVAAGPDS